MARKIFISSDIAEDEQVNEVTEVDSAAGLLWPWLLTAMDDWGRCAANPIRLKAQLFPLSDLVTPALVDSALRLFHDVGLITLYEVFGKRYAAVDQEKWWRYQTHIHKSKRESDDSRHPGPNHPDARALARNRGAARNSAEISGKSRDREEGEGDGISLPPVGGTGESEGDGASSSAVAVLVSGESVDTASGEVLDLPAKKPRKRGSTAYTPELRAEIVSEFPDLPDVGDQLDLAMAHPSARKYEANPGGYLRNWIRRYRREMDEHAARMAPRGRWQPPPESHESRKAAFTEGMALYAECGPCGYAHGPEFIGCVRRTAPVVAV